MSSQPNRILAAIMFTDMVGYTALMQVNETLARRKRKRHREVLAEFHAKYKGRIIQYFGDGTLSIFRSSVEAVQCAIEIQKQLRAPIEVPLRIGIHTGDIIIEKDNIIGDAVNVASRIESFSVPGAVMISDVVYEQVKNQPQFELQFLGQFQFKNVERPFGIYFLSNDGLIIPLAANLEGKGQRIQASKNYLPKVFTSFLGREKEIAELKGLISNNRLVTLTGPGGMGKTRLSIQVAREMENQFPDGVYWVPLASVTDPDTTTFVIAKNLDLKEDPVLSIEEVLTHFFHDSRALLVLDNFEQILRATDVIEKLLQFCDSLFILVTSRIVLQIAGEVEYPVPPLEVPNLQAYNSLEQLSKTPAVALFAERAEASGRKFQLTQENVEIVAKICLRLDGLPLAIELAAARTKVFKPKALLSRLNKRLDLLKSGGQFPVRHQTLRQTISWSYNLLNNEEQELFRRISVFVGKSTMEAIERVCGQNGLFDSNIADGVMALVDNSLLQTEETPDDLRFYMLETIREFAIEALEKSNTAVVLKKAHIQYFIQLAESAAPHLSGSEGERWRQVLYQEQGNFRASIGYAIALKDIALAYRVALALRMFWTSNGMVKEGIQQLEKLLAIPISKTLYPEKLKI